MAAVLLLSLLMPHVTDERPRIVIVTATAGFRHSSIELGEETLASIAMAQNAEVTFARTEDEVAARLTPGELEAVSAVVFLNTTGELPASAARALVDWVRAGGTFVGIHSASDTWHDDPDYLEMLGAEFDHHPPDANGEVTVEDFAHPSTASLTSPYVLFEELYAFRRYDPANVHLLLSLRREPGAVLEPLAWEKRWGRGRVLYTALGHREDVWSSEWFQRHLAGIVTWALQPQPAVPKHRAARH
jgi:type 1 glutamine amidotransferase